MPAKEAVFSSRRFLSGKAETGKILQDRLFDFGGFLELPLEFCRELLHPFLERHIVVNFGLFGADVAAGGEHVAVAGGFFQTGALTESGAVGVLVGVLLASPGVIRLGDAADLVVGKLAVRAINQCAEFASVDEQRLAATIPELAVLFVAGEKPQADGNLRGVKELAGECDHVIDRVLLDQLATDFRYQENHDRRPKPLIAPQRFRENSPLNASLAQWTGQTGRPTTRQQPVPVRYRTWVLCRHRARDGRDARGVGGLGTGRKEREMNFALRRRRLGMGRKEREMNFALRRRRVGTGRKEREMNLALRRRRLGMAHKKTRDESRVTNWSAGNRT